MRPIHAQGHLYGYPAHHHALRRGPFGHLEFLEKLVHETRQGQYLGQSLVALAFGIAALGIGTQVEVRSRRSLLAPVPAPSVLPVTRFSPEPTIRWSRPEPAPFADVAPARVRVVAWHEPCRELEAA